MRKTAQPATRERVSGFLINLIQTQVEASSVTMHHEAYKSSCPALASLFLGGSCLQVPIQAWVRTFGCSKPLGTRLVLWQTC